MTTSSGKLKLSLVFAICLGVSKPIFSHLILWNVVEYWTQDRWLGRLPDESIVFEETFVNCKTMVQKIDIVSTLHSPSKDGR